MIQASRHWAKTSVACEKEAVRLQAALVANTEDMQAAKSYLIDAKAHLEKIEKQQLDRQTQSAGTAVEPAELAREDSGQSDLEQLMGREEVLDHRPDTSDLSFFFSLNVVLLTGEAALHLPTSEKICHMYDSA